MSFIHIHNKAVDTLPQPMLYFDALSFKLVYKNHKADELFTELQISSISSLTKSVNLSKQAIKKVEEFITTETDLPILKVKAKFNSTKLESNVFYDLAFQKIKDETNTLIFSYLCEVVYEDEKQAVETSYKKQLDISEARNQILLDTIDEGIVYVDNSDKIVYANYKFSEIVGESQDNLIGQYAADIFMNERNDDNFVFNLMSLRKKGRSNQYELRFTRPDEQIRWLWASGSAVQNINGEITGSISVYSDITQRKITENTMLNAVIESQEEERKRLSRELHDGLGQILTAVRLNLDALMTKIDDFSQKESGNIMRELLNNAIQESRAISHNLLPKALEDFGLYNAINIMCEGINKSGKVLVTFTYNKEVDFNFQQRINIYRMVQEMLNNALKYSGSNQINIVLNDSNDGLLNLKFSDNGKGFDVDKESTGIGLLNLQKRSEYMGGTFSISSNINTGTTITVNIPMN